jgi:septum formation protein
MKKLVLASASPRRYDLLKQVGLDFEVIPADINETIIPGLSALEFVQNLSFEKAVHIAKKLTGDFIVIGADTVVVKNVILGKPVDEKHAVKMLKLLQGDWHEVVTGITVYDTGSSKYIRNYEVTRVKMKDYKEDTIYSYIKTGEPLDKAGGYGIQGIGALLVERIEGCYFNLVGLPLVKLGSMLEELGLKVL